MAAPLPWLGLATPARPERPPRAADAAGMGKRFRETMWFKLGAEASQPAPDEQVTMPVPLPIEDRYTVEVSAQDTATFGLHTGTTGRMKALKLARLDDDVPMTALVGELNRSKPRVIAIGAGVATLLATAALWLS